MSSPWPDELIAKLGVDKILKLKRLRRSDLDAWLKIEGIQLTEAEFPLVANLTQPDLDQPPSFVPSNSYLTAIQAHRTRSTFCAAAWLAGASWGQLGSLFSVTRQTIMASARKHVPVGDAKRLSDTHISLETLSAWYNWYMDSLQYISTTQMSVRDIATRFLTIKDE